MPASAPCPCGSGNTYSQCCGPYVSGERLAPTAEALMRSRYSAYHQGQIDYLIATRHPTHRQGDARAALARITQQTRWLQLKILQVQQGQPEDSTGTVEFMAVYQRGSVQQLHERSRFSRHRQRWYYVDGELLPPFQPGRNQPCWCGSGKKFKQCHAKTT